MKDHPGEKDDAYQAKESVEFTLDLPTSGVIKVEQMSKQGDLLPADDSAQVVVPPPKSLSVALVTTENYYLDRAIQSMNLKDPAKLSPDDIAAYAAAGFDGVAGKPINIRELAQAIAPFMVERAASANDG